MSYKLILAPVIALDEDVAALTAAAEIAEKFNAQPTALILALHLASTYMDKEAPLSSVLQDLAGGASSHAALLRQEWRTGPEALLAHEGIFLPEDFRALRRWLHGEARRAPRE